MSLEKNIIIEELLDFIKPRYGFPEEAENAIVSKQKQYFINYLEKNIHKIDKEKLCILKDKIKKLFYSIQYNPGESIGIICGQSIGERTTQGTLNSFHSAGIDTGAAFQTDSFHSIINATKKNKSDFKFFQVSLFLKDPSKSLKTTKDICIKYLNDIKFENLSLKIKYKNLYLKNFEKSFFKSFYEIDEYLGNNYLRYTLKLWELYFYRISKQELEYKLKDYGNIYIIPYYLLPENSKKINIYIKPFKNIFKTIKKLRELSIVGIPGINSHVFLQDKETCEWKVEIYTNNFQNIFIYNHIYNINKIICSSIYDFFSNFGILATQNLIIKKCEEVIPDIDPTHFKILAIKMTKNGYLEPFTRYTMRNNDSPLMRASFEECFETFLKAGKFKEKEKFKTLSSNIIAGKKPRIGTYQCDILMDPNFYSLV